jgi:catechol 2,3-dioxygenase-like lactoylglutathione lyase family enzyme
MAISVSHIGICVSDLERSMRFYCDGLGFEPVISYEIGSEFAVPLEVDGEIDLTSQMITRDGFMVELLHYRSPGVRGTPSDSRNILGMTHLSFNVDDVDAVGAKLAECGGTVIDTTRTKVEQGDFLFIADPDGTRIELMTLVQ